MAGATGRPDTVVHLLRHGEVHNPRGVLYGRLEGFHLSLLGHQMAAQVGQVLGERDITHVRCSPLERAQETAGPTAAALGLEPVIDPRVIESANIFEGEQFELSQSILQRPKMWRRMWNPFRPSWGEPYKEIVARMLSAVHDARIAAQGHEALVVSHQLPIWITRLHVEGRSFLHNPRKRHCTLCSVTSLHFVGDRITQVSYSEPAADLLPVKGRRDPFSSGVSAGPVHPAVTPDDLGQAEPRERT